MRLHCLQHEPFVGIGTIEGWAKDKGYTITRTRFYEGDELPLLGSFDMLVVAGGAMGARDEAKFPWMAEEKKFIRKAIATGKVVLGICLGAELISAAMGGSVAKGRCPEIGWFPVSLTAEAKSSPVFSALPDRLMVFQWHRDAFTLPPGARRLASSEACPDQAFEMGRAMGIQFHLEASGEAIESLIAHYGGPLAEGPHIQSTDTIRAGYRHLEELGRAMRLLLDRIDAELFQGR